MKFYALYTILLVVSLYVLNLFNYFCLLQYQLYLRARLWYEVLFGIKCTFGWNLLYLVF